MNNKSRTSLVLMELIITVLFFSIASAVCIRLFVYAHLISKQTMELNFAVEKAQSFAEIMRGTDGTYESIVSEFPECIGDGDSYFQIYYDENFTETKDTENALYVSDVTLSRVSKLQNMEINIVKLPDLENIYSLSATKYIKD